MRALLIALAVMAGLALALVAALWFFPGEAFRFAASFAGRAGVAVKLPSVSGNPAAGWTFDRPSASGEGFSVSLRRLHLDVDWASVARGRPAFDALWMEALAVDVRRPPGKAREKPADGKPVSLPPVRDLRLTDGRFTMSGGDAAPVEVREIEVAATVAPTSVSVSRAAARWRGNDLSARGHYDVAARSGEVEAAVEGCLAWPGVPALEKHCVRGLSARAEIAPGRVEIERLSATVAGSTVTAAGAFGLSPLEGRFHVSSTGPFQVTADAVGGARAWTVSGEARAGDDALAFHVAVALGGVPATTFELTARSVPAELVPGLPPALGRLSARVAGNVTGTRPSALSGSATIHAATTRGPGIDGEVKLDRGLVRADVAVSSGGLAGRLSGTWHLARSKGAAEARLRIDGAGLEPWAGVSVDGTVGATLEGGPSRHRVEVSVASGERTLDGSATGRWADGGWTSTWDRLTVTLGETWGAARPFTLEAGAAGTAVRNLRMSSGDAWLSVDGGVGRGRFRELKIRAGGVPLGPLTGPLDVPFDVAGDLTLDAAVAGKLSAPEATVVASVEGLAVSGTAAGRLSARARLSRGRIVAEEVTLRGPAGTLEASGSFPMSLAGTRVPPVRVRIRTDGLDPSALPLPEGVRFEKARLKGDLSVNAESGAFSAQGRMAFVAERVEVKSQGLDLNAVDVLLEADGTELKIVRFNAETGEGTFAASGGVTARDLAIAVRARDFSIDHPAGFSLRTDADLAMSGRWDAPALTGTIEVQEADVQPEKAKKDDKKRPDPPPSAPAPDAAAGSPLSADVRIVFDDNVWYKDGQSAIEFKGNVNVRKESGAAPRMFGAIETVRGEYIFYGRAFAFERGKVSFLGKSPPDPGLDVRAVYVAEQSNVKIYLNGKGTLRQPELSLTSEPPMEETDILSVLVTGAPRGAAGSGGAGEEAARLMAANYLAEQLRSRLQDRFSVDQLKLSLTDQGGAELTIGQNVTEDLYVSYANTLGSEGERRLNAEYTLTPVWSLNGTTSSIGRYVIDLLFKIGFR